MLLLTRKPGEKITIGDNIEIFIAEVHGKTVRIGISAPKDIPIMRNEIIGKPMKSKNKTEE